MACAAVLVGALRHQQVVALVDSRDGEAEGAVAVQFSRLIEQRAARAGGHQQPGWSVAVHIQPASARFAGCVGAFVRGQLDQMRPAHVELSDSACHAPGCLRQAHVDQQPVRTDDRCGERTRDLDDVQARCEIDRAGHRRRQFQHGAVIGRKHPRGEVQSIDRRVAFVPELDRGRDRVVLAVARLVQGDVAGGHLPPRHVDGIAVGLAVDAQGEGVAPGAHGRRQREVQLMGARHDQPVVVQRRLPEQEVIAAEGQLHGSHHDRTGHGAGKLDSDMHRLARIVDQLVEGQIGALLRLHHRHRQAVQHQHPTVLGRCRRVGQKNRGAAAFSGREG